MSAKQSSKTTGPVPPFRVGLAILAVALGAAIMYQRSSAPADVGLPESLVGTWTAEDSRYAERALVLATGNITFVTSASEGSTYPYPIVRIERESGDDPRLLTIRFRVGDQLQQLPLWFDEELGEIRLQNQPQIVWRQGSDLD